MDNKTRIDHALLRSLLLGYFGVQMPRTISDFLNDKKEELVAIGSPERNAILYQLSVMVKNNLLKQGKHKDGHQTENVYCSPSSSQVAHHKSGAVQPRKYTKKHVPEDLHVVGHQAQVTQQSSLQIDMSGCKGVVRIGVAGMIIEVNN